MNVKGLVVELASSEDEIFAEVDLADFLVSGELFGCPGAEQFALNLDVGAVADGERLSDVVVGDEDSDVLVFEVRDDFLYVVDGYGVDARRARRA